MSIGGRDALMKFKICIEKGNMDYYKNHLISKTHIKNLYKHKSTRKFCDICKDDIKNSSWNEHKKIHKAILSQKFKGYLFQNSF